MDGLSPDTRVLVANETGFGIADAAEGKPSSGYPAPWARQVTVDASLLRSVDRQRNLISTTRQTETVAVLLE